MARSFYANGKYFENGQRHYHTEDCVIDDNGKYFRHYYANLGYGRREISKQEFDDAVAKLKALNGKRTAHWSNVVLTYQENDI